MKCQWIKRNLCGMSTDCPRDFYLYRVFALLDPAETIGQSLRDPHTHDHHHHHHHQQPQHVRFAGPYFTPNENGDQTKRTTQNPITASLFHGALQRFH